MALMDSQKAVIASRNNVELFARYADPKTQDLLVVTDPASIVYLVAQLGERHYRKSHVAWSEDVARALLEEESSPMSARVDAAEHLSDTEFLEKVSGSAPTARIRKRAVAALQRIGISTHRGSLQDAKAWAKVRECTTLEEAAAYLEDPDPKSMGAAARRYATAGDRAPECLSWLASLVKDGQAPAVELPLTMKRLARASQDAFCQAEVSRSLIGLFDVRWLSENLNLSSLTSLPRSRLVEAARIAKDSANWAWRAVSTDEARALETIYAEAGVEPPEMDVRVHSLEDVRWVLGSEMPWVVVASHSLLASPAAEIDELPSSTRYTTARVSLRTLKAGGDTVDFDCLARRCANVGVQGLLGSTFTDLKDPSLSLHEELDRASDQTRLWVAEAIGRLPMRRVSPDLAACGPALLQQSPDWQDAIGAAAVVERILRENPEFDLDSAAAQGRVKVSLARDSEYLFERFLHKGLLTLGAALEKLPERAADWLHSQGIQTHSQWDAVFALEESAPDVPLVDTASTALAMA